MNPLECDRVEDELELFALDECAEPLRSAVDAHLASCASCRRSLGEARRLLGLLDLEYAEQPRLQRLLDRLDAEHRPARHRRLRWSLTPQLAAVAALVLMGLGLTWVTPGMSDAVVGPLAVVRGGRGDVAEPARGLAQEKGDVRATIWTSPRAEGQDVTADGISLSSGTLWVRVEPGRPFMVVTPDGEVVSRGGRFVVTTGPRGTTLKVVEGEAERR